MRRGQGLCTCNTVIIVCFVGAGHIVVNLLLAIVALPSSCAMRMWLGCLRDCASVRVWDSESGFVSIQLYCIVLIN